jgi:hypothetical protein
LSIARIFYLSCVNSGYFYAELQIHPISKSKLINEGRRQEAGGVFVTGIYTTLQKLFAFKGVSVARRNPVLDPIISITTQ